MKTVKIYIKTFKDSIEYYNSLELARCSIDLNVYRLMYSDIDYELYESSNNTIIIRSVLMFIER